MGMGVVVTVLTLTEAELCQLCAVERELVGAFIELLTQYAQHGIDLDRSGIEMIPDDTVYDPENPSPFYLTLTVRSRDPGSIPELTINLGRYPPGFAVFLSGGSINWTPSPVVERSWNHDTSRAVVSEFRAFLSQCFDGAIRFDLELSGGKIVGARALCGDHVIWRKRRILRGLFSRKERVTLSFWHHGRLRGEQEVLRTD